MPVQKGQDNYGYYYQWGNRKKYYYIPNNKDSEMNARYKAIQQGRAIIISRYKLEL